MTDFGTAQFGVTNPDTGWWQDVNNWTYRTGPPLLAANESVQLLGADPTGVVNSLPAFLTGFSSSNSRLYVPPGTYTLNYSAGVVFNVLGNFALVGAGPGISVLNFFCTSNASSLLFELASSNFLFDGLTLNVIQVGGQQTSVFGCYSNNITIRNSSFNGGATASSGVLQSTPALILFSGSGAQDNIRLLDSTVSQFNYPFLKATTAASTQSRVMVRGNLFSNNFGEDISFNSPNGSFIEFTITGNTVTSPLGATVGNNQIAIGLASCTFGTVANNVVTGAFGQAQVGAIHIEENTSGVTVTGNQVTVQGGSGIVLVDNNLNSGGIRYAPTNITITGNQFLQTGTQSGTYGLNVVFDNLVAANSLNITGNEFYSFQYGGVSGNNASQDSMISCNIFDSCQYGLYSLEGGMAFSKNTTSNCNVGLWATSSTGSMIYQDHVFSNCGVNCQSSGATHPFVLLNPSFVLPLQNPSPPSGGANYFLVLTSAGTNDRIYGYMLVDEWVPAVVADVVAGAYEVTWDGTTFTSTPKSVYAPGSITVIPQRNSTNLVLNFFSTSARTGVRITARLNGMISVFM